MTSPTVNAYSNPGWNEIVVPAGIIQYPHFSSNLPDYVNYDTFGATVGHKIRHGLAITACIPTRLVLRE
jgi:predicted metalloendopeptidase